VAAWAGWPAPRAAAEVMFSGSGALDYRAFMGALPADTTSASALGKNSLVLELAHKTVVDLSDRLSASVKVCFGCHGVEVDQGHAELHLARYANLRIGRINVPVGEFNTRHDPANYTTPSKPLPYAMGDLLFYEPNELNLGVVPTPYSDNGIELFGSIWFGDVLALDYTFYAVKGFAGENDLDFEESRKYFDNNATPAVGGRLVASVGPFSLGVSAGGGAYDAHDSLRYYLAGAEAYLHLGPFVLRGEWIIRRTEIDPTAEGYPVPPARNHFDKSGFYGQLDWEPREWLSLIYRFDGLRREGPVLPGSRFLSPLAEIFRHTGALAIRPWGGVLLKSGYELWTFSGLPVPLQHVVRVAVIYSY
jgi:hypothetical protein